MSSSTVTAQKLANEANVHSTETTNEMNYKIAQEANELNYKMFQEQNDWNREQWELENAYNDPSAQMERYIKAGINPLYAAGQMDAGNAQHLESAQAQPAHVATMSPAHVEPEYDPYVAQKISSITGAASSIVNDAQGFMKLALEEEDVDTRRASQLSTTALQGAQAAYAKAQTVTQDFLNNLNSDTYFEKVESIRLELQQLREEINKSSAETDKTKSEKALVDEKVETEKTYRNQIEASTAKIVSDINNGLEQVKQGWAQIAINQQNADINQQNADTQSFVAGSDSFYRGQELAQRGREFNFNKEKTIAELEHKSIQELLDFNKQCLGWADKLVGSVNLTFDGLVGGSQFSDLLSRIQCVGDVLQIKIQEEPWNYEAVKAFDDWQKAANNLTLKGYQFYKNQMNKSQQSTPSTYSVLNPDDY